MAQTAVGATLATHNGAVGATLATHTVVSGKRLSLWQPVWRRSCECGSHGTNGTLRCELSDTLAPHW